AVANPNRAVAAGTTTSSTTARPRSVRPRSSSPGVGPVHKIPPTVNACARVTAARFLSRSTTQPTTSTRARAEHPPTPREHGAPSKDNPRQQHKNVFAPNSSRVDVEPVTTPVTPTIDHRIAEELDVGAHQVGAAVDMLDGGSTVPFIARYRKEATGGLDDAQLRALEERLRYLRELDERRNAILESIRSQGKLDDALEARINEADSKARLEDIYLPYKPKRRTKAQIAREAGLEPLAEGLLTDPTQDPQEAAAAYID